MKITFPRLILAGITALPFISSHARADSVVTMEMKYHIQQKSSTSGDYDYGTVRTVRLDAKQLMALVARELNMKFPSGAQLRVADDGRVTVTDSRGGTIADVSRFLSANLGIDKRLFHGRANVVTGEESSRNYYPLALKMKLAALRGTVRGIATEDFKVTYPNRDGIQFTTSAVETPVNGKGKANGRTAYYDGHIYLKGRDARIAP